MDVAGERRSDGALLPAAERERRKDELLDIAKSKQDRTNAELHSLRQVRPGCAPCWAGDAHARRPGRRSVCLLILLLEPRSPDCAQCLSHSAQQVGPCWGGEGPGDRWP